MVFIGEDEAGIPLLVRVGGKALSQGYKAGMIVRKVAQYLEGSGGGRDDMASGAGKNKDKIPSLLKDVKGLLK